MEELRMPASTDHKLAVQPTFTMRTYSASKQGMAHTVRTAPYNQSVHVRN